MDQLLFKVQKVSRLENYHIPDTLEANVEVELIDRKSGDLLKQAVLPVRFNEHGAFPSIPHVRSFTTDKKTQTKLLFDIRRYIRRLRPFLEPDQD